MRTWYESLSAIERDSLVYVVAGVSVFGMLAIDALWSVVP